VKSASVFRPRSPLRLSLSIQFSIATQPFDSVLHCDSAFRPRPLSVYLRSSTSSPCSYCDSLSILAIHSKTLRHYSQPRSYCDSASVTLRFTQKHFDISSRYSIVTSINIPRRLPPHNKYLKVSVCSDYPNRTPRTSSSCHLLQSHSDRTHPLLLLFYFSALHQSDICKRIILEPTARVLRHHSTFNARQYPSCGTYCNIQQSAIRSRL
jgi:hypothetical protein